MMYGIFDNKGELIQLVQCEDEETLRLNTPPGCVAVEGYCGPHQYLSDGEVKDRPTMNVDCTYDHDNGQFVFTGIPEGATVTTPNWSGTVHDGEAAWPVQEPGRYKVMIELFPYVTEEIYADNT